MSELMITTSEDQPVSVNPQPLLSEISNLVMRSIQEKDVEIAFAAGESMIKTSQLAGLGLCKLLYSIQENWSSFDVNDTFEDYTFSRLGLSKTTITRYVRIWRMFESGEVPDDHMPKLLQRNIKDLSAIATAWESGYDMDKAWEKLSNAESNNIVLGIIRDDVKNVPARSNSIVIKLTRDGSLRAYTPSGVSYFIGYLNIDEQEDEPTIKKAIQRIINNSGIIEE